jgi:hypothetical protein
MNSLPTTAQDQDLAASSNTPRTLSVAKKPLSNLPAERRTEIAQQVLERYINGEQVAQMAPEYGVSDVTIYALLLREHEDDWKEVQKARALARKERAEEKCRTAPDALSLARAREELRSAQWELERLLRRLYGQDQQANVGAVVQINIALRRDNATVERVVSATEPPIISG